MPAGVRIYICISLDRTSKFDIPGQFNVWLHARWARSCISESINNHFNTVLLLQRSDRIATLSYRLSNIITVNSVILSICNRQRNDASVHMLPYYNHTNAGGQTVNWQACNGINWTWLSVTMRIRLAISEQYLLSILITAEVPWTFLALSNSKIWPKYAVKRELIIWRSGLICWEACSELEHKLPGLVFLSPFY